MKSNDAKILGTLQSKVMEIVWQSSCPLKPADVQSKLGCGYAYTTVMTILKRLTEKKILRRKLVGKAYAYSPVSCQQDFVKKNLQSIFGELVNSYGDVAISNFVDVIKNNKEDLTLLKDYLKKQK